MTLLEIEFPSRVTVALQVDEDNAAPVALAFIWGIGAGGLTDFELALSRRKKGEIVNLTVQPETIHGMFEHLADQVAPRLHLDGPTRLTARIETVEKVDNREVVRAMAGLQEGGCGCGGGGDCGCH